MPGETIAAVRSVPCDDATSTTSPSRDAELRRGRRIDLDPAAPHRRRQRIRHLLQPRQVRERAVEERGRGIRAGSETDTDRASPSNCGSTNAERARVCRLLAPCRRARAGGKRSPPAALLLRLGPRVERLRRRRQRRRTSPSSISSKVCHGRSSGFASRRPISSSTSGVARVWCSGCITGGATLATAIIEPDSGTRLGPRFEERVIRQDQVRQDARLVEEAAEADDERNLLERLAHLPRRRAL